MDGHSAHLYPSLALEKNEYGLLSENQLSAFYQNELYETAEDFVDEFLEVRLIAKDSFLLWKSRGKKFTLFHCSRDNVTGNVTSSLSSLCLF